jgi:CRP/FNR family transcriptional regulator
MKETALKNSGFFTGLPMDQMQALAAIAVSKKYDKSEMVFFEGDECHGFYLIVSGRVKIYKVSTGGKEHILHIFGPGEPFGEVPVFHGKPYPATASALSTVSLLFFPRKEFIDLLENNPAIAINMLGLLSMRLRKFAGQIETLAFKEVPSRLAGYLLYLKQEQGEENSVKLDITKGQLASLLGTIPETLSRIFAKMADDGLIEVQGKTIQLYDIDGLIDLESG